MTGTAPRLLASYFDAMSNTIKVGRDTALQASNAEEAVKKAKVLQAVGRSATIIDPDGVEMDIHTLELALRGNNFGDDA